MSNDTREDILVQLETLLTEVSGIVSVWRNRGGFPSNKTGEPAVRPAAILLDGGESLTMEIAPRKGVKMRPAIFSMKPQIFVVLELRDDVTNMTLDGVADPVGPALSDWRIKIKTAVENDPTLLTLLTAEGQIVYSGCDTDMQTGSTIGALGAHMQFHYEFRYVLFPPRS
jgi:hypothetical protein